MATTKINNMNTRIYYTTPDADKLLKKCNQTREYFLNKMYSFDWGILCESDKNINNTNLTSGGMLFAAYLTNSGEEIWIRIEADRYSTTIFLPKEYCDLF